MTQLQGWYTAQELAERVGIEYRNLWTYRKRGILPMPDGFVGNKPLWSSGLAESCEYHPRIGRPRKRTVEVLPPTNKRMRLKDATTEVPDDLRR